ncbi:hypothetical protein [Ancylomarina sp. 16SWW S1-10-2]|uniref:hypothetical protein n=1 Tax=Ancylomarina sp. 16SWW S1-10-2 TaxID=2499681 RepID=UPI0012AD4415|nr:hypothetical protein [Ancylomarina sp. 16SWW S1-10-2]MRT91913.1 hypothetical protein [Ancylomarina sp. 16SWW S1-10-2]
MNLKSFKFLLVAFLMTASVSLHAEDIKTETETPQTVLTSKYILNQYDLNRYVLSGAITTGYKYKHLFGGMVALDYRLSKRFSVGGQADIYVMNSDLNGEHKYSLALRSNYHILKFEKFRKNPLDIYFGVSVGAKAHPADVKLYDAFVGVHVGARYDLDEKWMVFAEVGTRNSALGLAVSF